MVYTIYKKKGFTLPVWIRLNRTKVIQGESKGRGDWALVGNDLAQKWIASGDAETMDYSAVFDATDCAAIHPYIGAKAKLPFPSVQLIEGDLKPHAARNLLMDKPYCFQDKQSPDVIKNAGRLAMVFRLLEKWDVVLFLAHYERTAFEVAHNEHDATRTLVKDLRVLYYADSIIGARDNRAGREFCAALAEERQQGRVLAPLRTLWRAKPMAYFLPPDWL